MNQYKIVGIISKILGLSIISVVVAGQLSSAYWAVFSGSATLLVPLYIVAFLIILSGIYLYEAKEPSLLLNTGFWLLVVSVFWLVIFGLLSALCEAMNCGLAVGIYAIFIFLNILMLIAAAIILFIDKLKRDKTTISGTNKKQSRKKAVSTVSQNSVPVQQDDKATASMVLGIVGLPFPIVAPVALIFGIISVRRGGGGKAVAGIVMGSIGTIFLLIGVAIIILETIYS